MTQGGDSHPRAPSDRPAGGATAPRPSATLSDPSPTLSHRSTRSREQELTERTEVKKLIPPFPPLPPVKISRALHVSRLHVSLIPAPRALRPLAQESNRPQTRFQNNFPAFPPAKSPLRKIRCAKILTKAH